MDRTEFPPVTTATTEPTPVDWPRETRRHHIMVVTLIAVAMAGISVMLHEYAHAVAQVLAGSDSSTLRAMSADPAAGLPAASQGWTAAAGPLFSLLAGLITWAVARPLRGAPFQMAFWFYVACIQNAAGYLIITPFGIGDTSVMVQRWGWPIWSQFAMTGLGVAMMFGLAALVAVDVKARFQSVRGLRMAVMWPVLWATIVLVVLSAGLGVASGYEAPVMVAMVMSMVSVYVAALMCSIFWGRFRFRHLAIDPGPLWFATLLAALTITVWVFHGIVGVTVG